jgi:hypothetical protein
VRTRPREQSSAAPGQVRLLHWAASVRASRDVAWLDSMLFSITVGDAGDSAASSADAPAAAAGVAERERPDGPAAAAAQFTLCCGSEGVRLSVGLPPGGGEGSCAVEGGSTTLLAVLLGQAEVSWAIVSGLLTVRPDGPQTDGRTRPKEKETPLSAAPAPKASAGRRRESRRAGPVGGGRAADRSARADGVGA